MRTRWSKNLSFTLIILLFSLSACDLFEDFLEEEIEIPITIGGDIEGIEDSKATSNDTDPVSVRSENAYYLIFNDPEIKELTDEGAEISKVEIKSIRYTYKNFEGNADARLLDGKMYIYAAVIGSHLTTTTQEFPFSDNNTLISEADFKNQVFEMVGDFSTIEEYLASPNSNIGFSYICNLSHNPVLFDIGITVNLTVFIKPPEL